ncbi:hypothetical protein LXL04_034339 [Taraxacum kok-saghyz]
MQKLAKELGVVIPVYNSIAIIDVDGTDLGFIENLTSQMDQEMRRSSTSIQVFQTKFAKIGVAICWDQWFPETARAMVLQSAELLFYPTAIGSEPQDQGLDSRDHWKCIMEGHAGASLVPLIASNRIGNEVIKTEHGDSSITFYGNSFIAGPTGETITCANDKEEAMLLAKLYSISNYQIVYIQPVRAFICHRLTSHYIWNICGSWVRVQNYRHAPPESVFMNDKAHVDAVNICKP